MKNKKRETIGKLSRDLLLKEDPITPTPTEQMREHLTNYEENIHICLKKHKKIFSDNFYIIVLTKKEKLMPNVIRNYFYGRKSCPTPDYDQIVYEYNQKDDNLVLLWVIPDRKTCKDFIYHSHYLDPSLKELFSYVTQFKDGSLFKKAQYLNGE